MTEEQIKQFILDEMSGTIRQSAKAADEVQTMSSIIGPMMQGIAIGIAKVLKKEIEASMPNKDILNKGITATNFLLFKTQSITTVAPPNDAQVAPNNFIPKV